MRATYDGVPGHPVLPVGGAPPGHAADRALVLGRGRFSHHRVGGPLDGEHLDPMGGRLLDGRLRRVIGVCVHAEKALLELAVGGQLGRGHRARDAAIDHHVDGVGDVHGDAEVLLDQ